MIAQRSLWVVLSLVLMYGQVAADPIGTAFTYQGRLVKNGTPVSSLPPHCNFTFGLFPVPAGGSQVGNSPQVLTGVAVTDGLFTVNIDFGAAAIDGTARWLDITVQCPGDAMPAILVPRQELKPAPHAIFGLLAGLAQSLLLPFEATAATSDPMLELTQTGDGPAALFKVQPQPEPPLPEPAVEAISETSAPAIEAANTGGGPAARVWVQPQPEPPLPVAALEVLNDTDGPAATFGIDPEFTPASAIVATNSGLGSAIEAVSNQVGPPESPTIVATNNGSGSAVKATSSSGNAVHAVSTMGMAGRFEGPVHVTGELTKAYTFATSNRATPIAYATVQVDAVGVTGFVGTPNVSSVVWESANQRFVVTIVGESYSSTGYITNVTPVVSAAPDALFATTGGSTPAGTLRVRIMSSSTGTTGLLRPFSFITYKP